MSLWIAVNARLADDADVRGFGIALLPGLPRWQAVHIACGLLVTLWGRLVDEQEDGDVSGRDDDVLEEWAKWRGDEGAFATLFRLRFVADGKVKHWEEYQGALISRRRRDRERHIGRNIPTAVKRAVFARDAGRCVECQSTSDLEYDHIIPWSEGGTHEADNLRLLCKSCHGIRTNGGGKSSGIPVEIPRTSGAEAANIPRGSGRNSNSDSDQELKAPTPRASVEEPATPVTPVLPAAARAERGSAVSRGLLAAALTEPELADVEHYLATIGARNRDGWFTEMLRMIGPATGNVPADLATACRHALLVEPIANKPGALTAFVASERAARLRAETPLPARPDRHAMYGGGAGGRPPTHDEDTGAEVLAQIRALKQTGGNSQSGYHAFIPRVEVEALGPRALATYEAVGGAERLLGTTGDKLGLLQRDWGVEWRRAGQRLSTGADHAQSLAATE